LHLPLATQEFITSGRTPLTLLEKWLGIYEKIVDSQFLAIPNNQSRTQYGAKDLEDKGPGDEDIEEEEEEYAIQQIIEQPLSLVLEDEESDLVIQDEELADLENEGAKDEEVEDERAEDEILIDPDILVYSIGR